MLCSCGRQISQPPRGRRRTKCEKCSPPDKRVRLERRAPTAGNVVQLPKPTRKSLAEQTEVELVAVDRLDTWQGAAALKAAELVDAGQYTAQGAAALLKAHREALELALEGAGSEADVIDLIFGAEA